MASAACVNNVGMLPEGFLDCTSYNPSSSPYGWFSPRISFSRDFVEEESKKASSSSSSPSKQQKKMVNLTVDEEGEDLEEVVLVGSLKNELIQKVGSSKDFGFGDFEFRLEEDPVKMLAADELFSDGKLVPRQLNTMRNPVIAADSSTSEEEEIITNSVPETAKAFRRMEITDAELYLFSPKAPRCSSRWKELLGLKRSNLNNNQNPKTHDQNQKISGSSSSSSSLRSGALKHFLNRNNPKSLSQSLDSSLNLPLLRDSDSSEILNNLPTSLSSSSSSSASSSQDEHPRFSLDSDPKHMSQISLNRNPPHRVRLSSSKSRPPTGSSSASTSETIQQQHTSVRARSSMHRVSSSDQSSNQSIIGLTIDSPRMNSSGKIVFQSLERSSSSPSTFNGGPRVKHRGVERSYSANVRVTPVLNVPVCSLRGSSKSGGGGGGSVFGFLSTPQKNNGSTSTRNHLHHHTHRNRSSSATATNSITDRN
ncbi:hypothetical protein MKW94_003697 [Papaver nudicaule]|uniref:Uncharacterized protein n=1 Tax=Papaver nudicaule TaxID=74823 RepID=A0AA42AYI5_PAPNU|nr:hypothetical protein [Papaver nudicaule]